MLECSGTDTSCHLREGWESNRSLGVVLESYRAVITLARQGINVQYSTRRRVRENKSAGKPEKI